MEESTKLVPLSVGLVIEDSIENSYYIRVIPIEQQGFIDGEIQDGSKLDEVKGVDSQGNPWETQYTTTNALTAKWYKRDSNARTAPTMHKGERVQLYRYGDSQDLFWEDIGQDTKNRTTERMVKVWSNKSKRDGEELDHTNAYYFEVDTKSGLITLGTNKSNGEPFGFTFQFQTKKGIFVLETDAGDSFSIDGTKKEVVMENSSGSFVQLLGDDVTLNAKGKMSFKAAGAMSFDAASVDYKVSGGYTIKSSTLKHNGANVGSDHGHMEQGDGRKVGPPI